MTLRDDLARVVAERRAANPRNEPGHVDYGIADAVSIVFRQAIRDLPVSFQTEAGFRLDPNQPVERIDHVERRVVLALFPEEHQQ